MSLQFRCAGCGRALPAGAWPFRCPHADDRDDADHVLVRADEVSAYAEKGQRETREGDGGGGAAGNPFVRFRRRFSAWRLAAERGLSDAEYVGLVERLDERIAEVDGRGFCETPFRWQADLAASVGFLPAGGLLVKDETGNVSGSHKGRHLAGIMLYLQVAERVGLLPTRPTLAIASCGNAALAAAVVARAADWPLHVFVPPSANRRVLARLEELDADIDICEREAGGVGDPCYAAFRRAVTEGAVPFCCQGSDNGLTIEGGETLAWEMLQSLDPRQSIEAPQSWEPPVGGFAPDRSDPPSGGLDAIFIQVGGGALASAIVQGLEERRRAGESARLPRVYAVQTAGGYPLIRAYDRLVARMLADWPLATEPPSDSPARLAQALSDHPALIDQAMAHARAHRSAFMWPWEDEPRSVAHGILDDETYDWAAVVEGMLRTGGRPIVVGEGRLEEANQVARAATAIDVDHTGSAGLAGVMEALAQEPALARRRVAVIFSGRRRM